MYCAFDVYKTSLSLSLCDGQTDIHTNKNRTHPGSVTIQRILVNTEALAHLSANLRLELVRLVVRGEVHVVNSVRKVMAVPVIFQVRHELVYSGLGRLEGASGREVDVPDDLVHPHETGNVAAFRRLLLDMVRPVFLNALQFIRVCTPPTRRKEGRGRQTHLVNPPRVAKTPAPPRVRLPDGIARVTASALGRLSAIARPTIPVHALLVQPINVVAELADLRTRDDRSCSRETGFGDVMGDVALDLPGYIHQVEGQYCGQRQIGRQDGGGGENGWVVYAR